MNKHLLESLATTLELLQQELNGQKSESIPKDTLKELNDFGKNYKEPHVQVHASGSSMRLYSGEVIRPNPVKHLGGFIVRVHSYHEGLSPMPPSRLVFAYQLDTRYPGGEEVPL